MTEEIQLAKETTLARNGESLGACCQKLLPSAQSVEYHASCDLSIRRRGNTGCDVLCESRKNVAGTRCPARRTPKMRLVVDLHRKQLETPALRPSRGGSEWRLRSGAGEGRAPATTCRSLRAAYSADREVQIAKARPHRRPQ